MKIERVVVYFEDALEGEVYQGAIFETGQRVSINGIDFEASTEEVNMYREGTLLAGSVTLKPANGPLIVERQEA